MSLGLTPKQHELFRYLESYMSGPGSVAPTMAEMSAALELNSKGRVHLLLCALEERGYIRRHRYRARAIELLRRNQPEVDIPHVLTLASDEQLLAEIDRRASIRRAA